MKKIITTLFFLAVAIPAGAWEFPRNPDRFPSLGVNFSNTDFSGHRSEIDQPNPFLTRDDGGPLNVSQFTVGGDVRLPASDELTFSLFLESVSNNVTFIRNENVYRQSDKFDGYRYGVGLRWYFNQ